MPLYGFFTMSFGKLYMCVNCLEIHVCLEVGVHYIQSGSNLGSKLSLVHCL